MVLLDGEHLTLKQAQRIAHGAKISINGAVREHINFSHAFVKKMAKKTKPVYGLNTGFGFCANVSIPEEQQRRMQIHLLRSHAVGYGPPLSIEETRLAMALRLNVLLQTTSGVSFSLCQTLCDLVNHAIYPVIPEYGSVGASGDLAPLAHLALPLMGEGTVRYNNQTLPASEALKMAGLTPYALQEKEGVALVNGTQIMLAVGAYALLQGMGLVDSADKIAALSYEALTGRLEALDPRIHHARKQRGQIASAKKIFEELHGSYLFDKKTAHSRVQDPYSLRCAPQIHGASRDALSHVKRIVGKELNASTDNPLVFPEQGQLLSGGNFHGQSLALAFDYGAMAIAEIGNVSERRLELLLNPHLSYLPPFLTPQPGINSGYMATQYLSASLVNENKLLANPSCTDSIPGNAGIEDHVSMGMTSARKWRKLIENTCVILAIEMMAAAQAIDLRGVQRFLGKGTAYTYALVREHIPKLIEDRILSQEIQEAAAIVKRLSS